VSVGEPRFKAAIVISGQGTKAAYLGEDSWKEVAVPMYVLTGSLDASPPQMGRETPESRQEPFYLSRGTAKGGPAVYLMFIEGATHSSYGGKAASSLLGEKPTTDVKEIGAAVQTGTTLFLDSALRADADAKKTLESERMAKTIPGKVRFEHK
jgi:hypothetical protein